MSKAHPPELKKFMDRKMSVKVNGGRKWCRKSYFQLISLGRKVEGVLRGFDPFMNLVIDDAIEYRKGLCILYRSHVLTDCNFRQLLPHHGHVCHPRQLGSHDWGHGAYMTAEYERKILLKAFLFSPVHKWPGKPLAMLETNSVHVNKHTFRVNKIEKNS